MESCTDTYTYEEDFETYNLTVDLAIETAEFGRTVIKEAYTIPMAIPA